MSEFMRVTDFNLVAEHYTRGNLLDLLRAGVEKLGKTTATVTVDDLAPVDEFHIGGRQATRAFLDQLSLAASHDVLDIGCGIGGASRFAATAYGCRLTGIDLTDEYVQTGNALCGWVGLQDRVKLVQGNVLATTLRDAAFDRAFMLHVGMNIIDKAALAREVWRVLKPGGRFGIYDVMRISDEPLIFPVPWASVAQGSAVATPDEYRRALADAGFEVVGERNRSEFALEFFERLKAQSAGSGGPPPLGLHLLMGPNAATKVRNMIENIAHGRIAPVELIVRKA